MDRHTWANSSQLRSKNTLASGNAGDEKNLHPSGRKFIFLIDFPEIFSFLLLFFLILVFVCFLVWCFLKLRMYILIHIRLCGQMNDKKFSSGRFPETRLLFFWPEGPKFYVYLTNRVKWSISWDKVKTMVKEIRDYNLSFKHIT